MGTKSVWIGIHVHAQPHRLRETLDSVRLHTRQAIDILLLPDGPDAETRAFLATLSDLPMLATAQPLGAPACFNHLVTHADADVYVLLESGSVVGPDWLTHLSAALSADPTNGLAGPSTNMAWNEQRVFPQARGSLADVAHTAAEALRRFEDPWHCLEPLYSLADFCYVVRREVIEGVGAADEAYGLGPCWEMDYNIRAARAGFRGVWARHAYVYRHPFTARRRREETQCFTASKHRYQDKYCALHLRRERTNYEPDCRGEACEHFAPPELIQIRLPLPKPERFVPSKPIFFLAKNIERQPSVSSPKTIPLVSCIMPTGNRSVFALQAIRYFQRQAINSWSFTCGQYLNARGWRRIDEPGLPSEDRAFYVDQSPAAPMLSRCPSERSVTSQPLVSCIMPTANRRAFVGQAIQYFLRQNYPNCELIVVDDGSDSVADLMPVDPKIRYMRMERRRTVGAKRNIACQDAKGEIIIHWDDDDWMAPWRVSYQVASLLREEADICGLDTVMYYDPGKGRAWQYICPTGGKPWVAGKTLCYTKAFWRGNPFPEINVGEDTRFVWNNTSKKIFPLQDFSFYVALIHPWNISPKRPGGSRWQSYPSEGIRDLMGEDWSFYAHLLQGKAEGTVKSFMKNGI